jgi:hypothetical protein
MIQIFLENSPNSTKEAVMLGINNVVSFELAFSCKIKRSQASTARGQSWMSSARSTTKET